MRSLTKLILNSYNLMRQYLRIENSVQSHETIPSNDKLSDSMQRKGVKSICKL
jgi:hypothetical protein